MSTHDSTNYSVNSRIAALQNAVTELQKENREIRVHLFGQLQNLVREATSTIQASLRMPADGKDGRDGVDGQSIVGPQGIQGLPGKDCTMPTESELAEAVTALRLKLAKWQSAIAFAYEQNYHTKHQGLKKAIELTLQTVENRANS